MKWVLGALALLVAATGAYVVLVLPGNTPDLDYRTLSIQLGDPDRVRVTFQVSKDPKAKAECSVTATGKDKEIVNRLIGIPIPPSTERTTTHVVTVETDQPATDAAVTYCALTG